MLFQKKEILELEKYSTWNENFIGIIQQQIWVAEKKYQLIWR